MAPTARDIIAAADEALRRAGAPICYLHRDGTQGPYAAVITVEHLTEITSMIPKGAAISTLMMDHGHIEGDEDDDEQRASLVVQPTYASIECVRELVEPWIELLGGDEWGENMRDLHGACRTDYGFSDEDCALFASKLFENLELMKTSGWIDHDGPRHGTFTAEDVARTQQRCVEVREYWRKGGNLGNWEPAVKAANETLATVSGWVFGEEQP